MDKMRNVWILLRKKWIQQKQMLHYGRRNSPKERAARLRRKCLSLLLVSTVGFGTLGFFHASAMPRTGSEKGSRPGTPPVSLQLQLPYCSATNLLPCGSESVSELMLLHYWGIPASLDSVVSSLQKAPLQQAKSGGLLGPNPNTAFAGNPRKKGSAGCFADPVAASLSQLLPPQLRAKDATGASLDSLLQKYVANGEPVLLWATVNMDKPSVPLKWNTPEGGTCCWPRNTDCMVLVGYDQTCCWLEDPENTAGPTRLTRQLTEERYNQLGRHCVTVSRTRE
ncbi:hypothetical protein B6259_00470 [Ruminococcaceae bacterium CPB6]|jgi:uncharacterized protein YvpB|nr:hypothetical protein B6259_00470 [Ruminococcaceae bacterium CPB6]MDD4806898.1 C39 family peptidase [Oscillospiraceae bacterium]